MFSFSPSFELSSAAGSFGGAVSSVFEVCVVGGVSLEGFLAEATRDFSCGVATVEI